MKLEQLPQANKIAGKIETLQFRNETISKAINKLEELSANKDTVAVHIPNNHIHIEADKLLPIFTGIKLGIVNNIKELTADFEEI